MDDLKIVKDYYTLYEEDNRLLRDHAHKIEFLTTIHYLNQLIKPGMHVLEVGAGTGRYSYYFANLGATVTAFELVSKNIEILQEKQKDNPKIEIIQGDVRNLSSLYGKKFDVVLCLGPLYHLGSDSDKTKCILECMKVTKINGIIAFAYINQYSAFVNSMLSDITYLNKKTIDHILDTYTESGNFHFLNPQKIEDLLEPMPFKKMHHIAVDGLNYILRNTLNQLTEEQFDNWLYYHLRTCEEPSILGYSSHGLIIGKKKAEFK